MISERLSIRLVNQLVKPESIYSKLHPLNNISNYMNILVLGNYVMHNHVMLVHSMVIKSAILKL